MVEVSPVEFGSLPGDGLDLDAHLLPLTGPLHLFVVHLNTRHPTNLQELKQRTIDNSSIFSKGGGGGVQLKSMRTLIPEISIFLVCIFFNLFMKSSPVFLTKYGTNTFIIELNTRTFGDNTNSIYLYSRCFLMLSDVYYNKRQLIIYQYFPRVFK